MHSIRNDILLSLTSISSFDVDLPIECDDEYWENPDPETAFKQPPGKPANASFFICLIKLNQILAFALRTIVRVRFADLTKLILTSY